MPGAANLFPTGGVSADTAVEVLLPPGRHRIRRSGDLIYSPKGLVDGEALPNGANWTDQAGNSQLEWLQDDFGNSLDYYANVSFTGQPNWSTVDAAKAFLAFAVPRNHMWTVLDTAYGSMNITNSGDLSFTNFTEFGASVTVINVAKAGNGTYVSTLADTETGTHRQLTNRIMEGQSNTFNARGNVMEYLPGNSWLVLANDANIAAGDQIRHFRLMVSEKPRVAPMLTIEIDGQVPRTVGANQASFELPDSKTIRYTPNVSGVYDLESY